MEIAKLFGVFLLIVLGLALTPTVAEMVTSVTGTGGNNLTGAFTLILKIILVTLCVGYGRTYSVILGRYFGRGRGRKNKNLRFYFDKQFIPSLKLGKHDRYHIFNRLTSPIFYGAINNLGV